VKLCLDLINGLGTEVTDIHEASLATAPPLPHSPPQGRWDLPP